MDIALPTGSSWRSLAWNRRAYKSKPLDYLVAEVGPRTGRLTAVGTTAWLKVIAMTYQAPLLELLPAKPPDQTAPEPGGVAELATRARRKPRSFRERSCSGV